MSTLESSASAYDRLSVLTDKYTTARALSQGWTRILSTLTDQKQLLAVAGRLSLATADAFDTVSAIAEEQHQKLDAYLEKIGGQMDTLNHQIQNGVFEHGRQE